MPTESQDRRNRLIAKVAAIIIAAAVIVSNALGAMATEAGPRQASPATASAPVARIARDGSYTSRDDVALYLHEYGELPPNFVTKSYAYDHGWVPEKGNLDEVCPGKSIGGNRFYNDDGLLPDAKGRRWYECDIDYHGGRRGPKRIVFSSDGLVYYTGDHYRSFERLY